jgi:RNA polymerase sigma-70 factor, ECF subfamily
VNVEQLFEEVYPQLHRYCARLTADIDAAEDAAQEAFVRLLDRKVQGEPEGLRAWLFKVATHLIRDRVRVQDNRVRLLEENPVMPPPPERPDEHWERAERIRTVRQVLDTLEPRDRELLLLREEGFSYRELAEQLGVQPSSIGTLLARARTRFAQAMAPERIDTENGRK